MGVGRGFILVKWFILFTGINSGTLGKKAGTDWPEPLAAAYSRPSRKTKFLGHLTSGPQGKVPLRGGGGEGDRGCAWSQQPCALPVCQYGQEPRGSPRGKLGSAGGGVHGTPELDAPRWMGGGAWGARPHTRLTRARLLSTSATSTKAQAAPRF